MEAYKAIEAMRRRSIILSPYLDTRMVEDIYKVRVEHHEDEGNVRPYGGMDKADNCTLIRKGCALAPLITSH